MSADIVERLRALSRCEHSDLSIGDEAAADALGAVRETGAIQCLRSLATVIREYGTCAPAALEVIADRLEAALAQAPAVRVTGEMANLRSAIMRLDGQSRRDTLVAYRKLEAALGQGRGS